MTETNLEEKRVRGFAGLIASGLLPLNENQKFKEQFANTDIKILLNAINVNCACKTAHSDVGKRMRKDFLL